MRNSTRYLLVCSVLLLTGIRDPFRPPDDPLPYGELAQWALPRQWSDSRRPYFTGQANSAGIA